MYDGVQEGNILALPEGQTIMVQVEEIKVLESGSHPSRPSTSSPMPIQRAPRTEDLPEVGVVGSPPQTTIIADDSDFVLIER